MKKVCVLQAFIYDKGDIHVITCGNLTRFVYILRSIEGVFDNHFLGFWWRAKMTPSAEYTD